MSDDDAQTIDGEAEVERIPRTGCFLLMTPWQRRAEWSDELYEITDVNECSIGGVRRRALELGGGALNVVQCAIDARHTWSALVPSGRSQYELGAPLEASARVLDADLGDQLPHRSVRWHEPCDDGHTLVLHDRTVVTVRRSGYTLASGHAIFLCDSTKPQRAVCRLHYPIPRWHYVKLVAGAWHVQPEFTGIEYLGLMQHAPDAWTADDRAIKDQRQLELYLARIEHALDNNQVKYAGWSVGTSMLDCAQSADSMHEAPDAQVAEAQQNIQ